MKRKTIVAAVAVLATIGTAGVLSAKGGWHDGGFGHGFGRHGGGKGHHGMFGMFGMDDGGLGLGHGRRGLARLIRSDADRDGAVTLDEFLKDRADRFAALDKSGDGAVDGGEFAARLAGEMDYRRRVMAKSLDANGDGKVTKDDFVARARERFAERDFNGDGVISRDDLPAFARAGDDRAGDIDADDDGDGDQAGGRADGDQRFEGRRGHRGWRKGSMKLDDAVERAERRFERLDSDKNGQIDDADVAPRMKERTDFAQQMMLRRFDKDRDGKVTRDEFLARPKQRFATLDLDGDGKITAADMSPGMAERWQKRTESERR